MSTIEEDIAKTNWEDYDEVVKFYESNQLYFNNYQRVSDNEKISELINIKLYYCKALFNKYHYDRIIPIIGQLNDLLAKLNPTYSNYSEQVNYKDYLYGMVLGHKQEYKKAYPIF